MKAPVPTLPAQAPRAGGVLGRGFGRLLLRLGGWRVDGEFPDLPRLVIIAAPHSSAWDVIWGLAAKLALGVHIDFMVKQEAFVGPLGWLLRSLGAIAVDRGAAGGAARQAANRLREAERMWFVLAPEGTRKPVQQWKSGFWHIARNAETPVLCAAFHFPERRIIIGPTLTMSEDLDADMTRIRAWYRPFQGKNRGT